MRLTLILALAEIREGLRNRWIATAILGLTIFTFSLAMLGSVPIGDVKASAMNIMTVSLSSLSVYLIPLICLMLAFDTIVGEAEHGTLLLLFTYPVKRWQILVGKFLGHIAILSLAVITSYGLAGLYISLKYPTDITEWLNYSTMIASTLLLGSVFLSIGYLVSVLVKARATAMGASIVIWLVMVVAYDFMLLGMVLSDKEQIIDGKILATLIYMNPTDIYRLFNLAGNDAAGLITGLNDLAGTLLLQPLSMLIALLTWIVVPLSAAIIIFHRREI